MLRARPWGTPLRLQDSRDCLQALKGHPAAAAVGEGQQQAGSRRPRLGSPARTAAVDAAGEGEEEGVGTVALMAADTLGHQEELMDRHCRSRRGGLQAVVVAAPAVVGRDCSGMPCARCYYSDHSSSSRSGGRGTAPSEETGGGGRGGEGAKRSVKA